MEVGGLLGFISDSGGRRVLLRELKIEAELGRASRGRARVGADLAAGPMGFRGHGSWWMGEQTTTNRHSGTGSNAELTAPPALGFRTPTAPNHSPRATANLRTLV